MLRPHDEGRNLRVSPAGRRLAASAVGLGLAPGARADLPILIDPVLTYRGGTNDDAANAVARDAQGLVYVAGRTFASPTSGRDVLVSCIDFSFTPPAGAQAIDFMPF